MAKIYLLHHLYLLAILLLKIYSILLEHVYVCVNNLLTVDSILINNNENWRRCFKWVI